jgi:hypothetical protein
MVGCRSLAICRHSVSVSVGPPLVVPFVAGEAGAAGAGWAVACGAASRRASKAQIAQANQNRRRRIVCGAFILTALGSGRESLAGGCGSMVTPAADPATGIHRPDFTASSRMPGITGTPITLDGRPGPLVAIVPAGTKTISHRCTQMNSD